MLIDLLKQKTQKSIMEYNDFIRQGMPLTVFGVNDSYKSYLVSTTEAPVLFIVNDLLSAGIFKDLINGFCDKKVVIIPPKDELLIQRKAFSKDTSYLRLLGLSEIHTADVVICPIETVMQKTCSSFNSINISCQNDFDLNKIISDLVVMGYKKTDSVQGKGMFSVRGDILDLYPVNYDNPIKIDFFGDTVERIREYNFDSRKIERNLDSITVIQAVEKIYSESEINEIDALIKKACAIADKESRTNLLLAYENFKIASENKDYDAMSVYASIVDNAVNISGLIKKDTVVIFDEPKRSYDTAKLAESEFLSRFDSLKKSGNTFPFMESAIIKADEIKDAFSLFREVAFLSLSSSVPFFNPLKILNPKVSSISNYRLDFKEIFVDVNNWLKSGYSVLISTGKYQRSDSLCMSLSENGIASSVDKDNLPASGVLISSLALNDGFVFHDQKIAVIGSGNLYSKSTVQKRTEKKKATFFNAPEVGDYAVHEIHGIGRVLGSKKISTTEGTKDYIAVEYLGGDVLYIPVDQMDLLTRYLGAEKTPKLSKIGGKDFERVKNSVKESIKKMSFDLKKLYEERKDLNGFCFEEDEEIQKVFENAFEFEDTPDQAQANKEILDDMTSKKVMDRLVCGDVGFGKTEVALRAIFRAVINGKQAVMLAPTTILTEQHYSTALKRFDGFGVKIKCLNRFRTKKEQLEIIDGLKSGEIDFVIGTHRLLGKDVSFKNLGLLVLDEEQRFGVEHKEKIKLLKSNVDTLTLTATPIPRTLHMSLSGIREISTINTPPKKRLPVQTYVTEETDALLKDAISREINRGGQVFLLYNRVESIYKFATRVKGLLPDVKITVAHGQMDERSLEKNIYEFYSGESDVLISTTIIENGIDLPRANTLVVIDADNFGLSTLYQLKGRVGRSDRLAYAYFTYKPDKILTDTAYHRLNAIIEFTEMGSGIKIAMRDLEIRGAGNVLGAEQHGHMEKIGYELYSKLLREELLEEPDKNVELDVRVDAFIPEWFIERNSLRMDAYKEIAEISSYADAIKLSESLKETYGPVPEETQNLIEISTAKLLCKKLGGTEIVVKKDNTYIAFDDLSIFSDGEFMETVKSYGDRIRITVVDKPKLEFTDNTTNRNKLSSIVNFLDLATKNRS